MVQQFIIPQEILDDLKKEFYNDTQIDGKNVIVKPTEITKVCRYLKEKKGFDHLSNLSGVDLPNQKQMSVVYHLWSSANKHLITLKVFVPRDAGSHVCKQGQPCEGAPGVDSIADVYPAADWHEREAFDLLGIVFKGHPNLQRLLLKEDWIGHPLRKDDTSGVPPYQIDWKLALMRSSDKAVFNMDSINRKLNQVAEAKEK